MKKKKKLLSIVLIVPAVILVACAGQQAPAEEQPSLEGTSWILESLQGNAILEGTSLTANFGDDGMLSGSAGCNNFSAQYEVDGSQLKIGPAMSTMMACEPAVMDQESAYLAALAAVVSYRVRDDKLSLLDQDGQELLVYTPQDKSLAGTAWKAIAVNNGQEAVTSLIAGTEITAEFKADGKLSGKAGCNNYHAEYQVEDGKITIGPAAVTRMFCAQPEGVMEQESLYLTALETAATYDIQGNKMEMRTSDGAIATTFEMAR